MYMYTKILYLLNKFLAPTTTQAITFLTIQKLVLAILTTISHHTVQASS